jgi:hypothetical protein
MRPGGRIRPRHPVADLNNKQSTSVRGVGGWNGREMASRFRFYEGSFINFFGRVGFKAQRCNPGKSSPYVLPSSTSPPVSLGIFQRGVPTGST